LLGGRPQVWAGTGNSIFNRLDLVVDTQRQLSGVMKAVENHDDEYDGPVLFAFCAGFVALDTLLYPYCYMHYLLLYTFEAYLHQIIDTMSIGKVCRGEGGALFPQIPEHCKIQSVGRVVSSLH